MALLFVILLGLSPDMARADECHEAAPTAASSWQGTWDFFTNFGNYMPRIHCMRLADGSTDWPWVIGLVSLTLGVVIAYGRIFIFWRKAYLEVVSADRNKKLMDLAYVFLWCAICGYAMSILMFVWPAYRLLAIFLLILNFFSWRFAANLGDLRVSLSAKALQRQLGDALASRNQELERLVADKTAALRESESQARVAAATDALTGLPNRCTLVDRLGQVLIRTRRHSDQHFAVLFLDFDRFKIVNDSLGHAAGDTLLFEISKRLRTHLRETDTVVGTAPMAARFGGDEFVVLLDGLAQPNDACIVAQRLLELMAQPYYLNEHEIFSTASIGIVTSELAADTPDAILRDADTAMYEAKMGGRGRYVLFDASMRERVQDRLALESEFQRALGAGQFTLVYQPIVSLATGRLEGAEALLRWNHPRRGVVSPQTFIPIAEETGLIVPIGEWVIRTACTQFQEWRSTMGDRAPASISVNVSRKQLLAPGFVAAVRRILSDVGLEPAMLHLEITESHMMQDAAVAVVILQEFKALGVRIDMDDFGTGYSSLACLRQFPLDVLKLDRAFVASLATRREVVALVQAIVHLASNFNIHIVAEGIENADQVTLLQSLDCQWGQGYFFSKPLEPSDFERFSPVRATLPQP